MSKKNKLANMTRRNFLKTSSQVSAFAFSGLPIHSLMDLVTKNLIQQARAESTGQTGGRNYVNLLLFGAPARYAFDHWQKTNVSDPDMIYNPMVSTAFKSSQGKVTDTEYRSFLHNNTLVPHFFANSVQTSAGQVALTNLLENMLVIRGYGTGVDGHPLNVIRQLSPLGGASSISGLAADYSSKYFQAIQWPDRGDTSLFNSTAGYGVNKIFTSDQRPLNSLLESFIKPTGSATSKLTDNNSSAFDLAKARLKNYIGSNSAGSKILASNYSNAEKLMKAGVNNIDGYWAEAVSRYRNLIESSMRARNISGLSDATLISTGENSGLKFESAGPRVLAAGFNAIDMTSTMSAGNLAASFALTEYVLKEKLCTSVEICELDRFYSLTYQAVGDVASSIMDFSYDIHENASKITLLKTAALFRGVAAAILELSTQLKAVATTNGSDLWSDTVFQITSDFNRSARTDGLGSDHGFNQMVTSVYSGAIKNGPYVVGNIKKTGLDANFAGTQGVSSSINGYTQNGMPNPLMAASTVAELLAVPHNPYANSAAPLIKVSSSGLILPFGKGVLKDE